MIKNDPVIKAISSVLISLILIFGFYIHFHGDVSPGGGFQAGAIFASGMILYSWLFDIKNTTSMLNLRFLEIGASLGIMIYLLTGVFCMIKGGNFFDYSQIIIDNKIFSSFIGVLLVETGVCITVCSVFLFIYFSLSNFIKDDV